MSHCGKFIILGSLLLFLLLLILYALHHHQFLPIRDAELSDFTSDHFFYMNFILPNTAAQCNIDSKVKIVMFMLGRIQTVN